MNKTIITILIVSLIVVTGCNSSSNIDNIGEIYAFINTTDNTHWQQVAWGLQAYGDEHDIKINVIELDIENQLKSSLRQIKNSIDKNTGAIIIEPFDSNELESHLKKAHKKDIPLIYLSERPKLDIPGTLVYTDKEEVARKAGQVMAKLVDENGEIVVVGICNTTNKQDEKETGFIDAILDYPEIDLINVYDCRSNTDIAKQTVLDIFSAYPDIEGLYTTCPEAAIGAVEALVELGIEADVEIVSFDYNDELMRYIKDRTISAAVSQNHYQIGYKAAEVTESLLKGESIPDTVDIDCDFISRVLEK